MRLSKHASVPDFDFKLTTSALVASKRRQLLRAGLAVTSLLTDDYASPVPLFKTSSTTYMHSSSFSESILLMTKQHGQL